MSLLEARTSDRAGEIESAAAQNEEALKAGQPPLRGLLDLAVLYWQATDPGLAAAHHISPAFMNRAGRRSLELVDEAIRLYPKSTEARFWKRYIAWADLGDPFDVEDCRRLLREDPTELVPAMYVFSAGPPGLDVEAEARELLRQSREEGTMRARYIVSVIEAALQRARRDI